MCIFSFPFYHTKKNHFCVNCVNIYKLLKKTLCESILFIFSPYCTRYNDLVLSCPDSERGNPLPPHGLLFPISSKVFYMHHSIDRITHTTAIVTPVVEHWLERALSQWVHHEGSIRRPIAP